VCGIAGWFVEPGREPPGEALARMSACLAHRGPDGEGEWRDPERGLALAHRRLAILDLTPASAQPMVDPGSGVVLVYNGELYDHRERRAELESLGHTFRSRGDVEVVLRAVVAWRERAFERFAGMFALAAWDPRDATLWLARDALGMKPLYLAPLPGGVAFASEVKALLELPGVARALDRRGLAEYLEFGYRIEEGATIFAGISRLAPAEVVGFRAGREVARCRHFAPPRPDPGDARAGDERAEELLAALRTVVAQHLVADVPVGLLLSGGVDSSLLAALAAERGEVTSVSMGFAESDHDERSWARRAAEAVGARHAEIAIAPAEVAAEIESAAWVFDDLFADWGTVTTRILYRKCRELGLAVALVGEGADELFGGYPSFRRARGAWTPWATAGLYRHYASRRWGGLYGEFRRAFDELAGGERDLFEAVRRFELARQLPGNYVMKVDKASMSVSLEARAPYLDRRIAGIALRTPRAWLLRDGTEKWLLRAAARRSRRLPPEIVDRPKAGGSIAASWLDEAPSFREFARERVLRAGGWAERLGLRRAMERYFAGTRVLPFPSPVSHLGQLGWRLLLLELWAERYGVEEIA
jgi:asparagine synthase (glutamine-hydrolysing)